MINLLLHNKFFIQAAIFCSCLFIISCENDEKDIDDWSKKVTLAEEAYNINTLFSQAGNRKAQLTSPLMLRYQTDTPYIEFPKTLHVNFFNEASVVDSWLDARYGKYLEHLNMVLLQGNVTVININGDTLKTSELWWDQNKQLFYTDKEVRITTLDKRIRGGKGLEAAQDISWYTIKEPTGTVQVEESVLPN